MVIVYSVITSFSVPWITNATLVRRIDSSHLTLVSWLAAHAASLVLRPTPSRAVTHPPQAPLPQDAPEIAARHFLAQVCDNADAICAAAGAHPASPALPPGWGSGASASDSPTRGEEGGIPGDLPAAGTREDAGASRVDGAAVRAAYVVDARARVTELLAVAGLASGDGGAGSVLGCLLRHGWAAEFSMVGSILTAGETGCTVVMQICRLYVHTTVVIHIGGYIYSMRGSNDTS